MIGLIDIGGTKLMAAVAHDDGTLGPVIRRDTPADDAVLHLEDMLDEARDGGHLQAIAMAVPGPFARSPLALVNPPSLDEQWWNLNLEDPLSERFGCPVLGENDANCAALAEAAMGAGRGLRSVVYLTVSTGIGTGVVVDGRLQPCRQDTEGGHIVLWPRWLGGPPCDCGGHGCLETLASGRGLFQRFGRPADEIDDPEIWAETGRWLGLGLTAITALLDPDCIVMGGGICGSWERFAPAMERVVAESVFTTAPPVVRRAELGPERNLLGALQLLRVPVG